MMTITQHATPGRLGEPQLPTPTDAAQALARGFLCYASACWRGDERAPIFGTRLGAYWRPEMPPLPLGGPDAISPHGAGGQGIHWYQAGAAVLGFIPGERGGFQVPIEAIPPLVRCTGTPYLTARPSARRVIQ